MKYSINEEERKTLGLIWEKTLQNFPEGTETDMEKSLADYIENCGLPETDEHGAFTFSAFISSIRLTKSAYCSILCSVKKFIVFAASFRLWIFAHCS